MTRRSLASSCSLGVASSRISSFWEILASSSHSLFSKRAAGFRGRSAYLSFSSRLSIFHILVRVLSMLMTVWCVTAAWSSSGAASAAAVQQLCASVNATPSVTSHTIASNAAFVGDGCLYGNFTMTLCTLVGNIAASVDINGGMVSEGNQSGLLFQGFTVSGPANADLGNKGSLRIAMLMFDRLFPNRTSIVVEGNTFFNLSMQGVRCC